MDLRQLNSSDFRVLCFFDHTIAITIRMETDNQFRHSNINSCINPWSLLLRKVKLFIHFEDNIPKYLTALPMLVPAQQPIMKINYEISILICLIQHLK